MVTKKTTQSIYLFYLKERYLKFLNSGMESIQQGNSNFRKALSKGHTSCGEKYIMSDYQTLTGYLKMEVS